MERTRFDVVEKRITFCLEIQKVQAENLIFLDEMGVNLGMTPKYARAPVGERAVCNVPGARGTNVSIIAAARQDKILSWYPYDGAVNGYRFMNFVREHLAPHLRPGDVVVLDNVRFHHIADVKKIIHEKNAQVLYIPPYHPELNAIEEVFSIVKRKIRQIEPRNLPGLVRALRTSFTCVTTKSLQGCVRHMLTHAIQPV